MGKRIVVAVASLALVLLGFGVPANAVETHSVTLDCRSGSGDRTAATIDVTAGDLVLVTQTGCVWFKPYPGNATVVAGQYSADPSDGYQTMSGTQITFRVGDLPASGGAVAYFSSVPMGSQGAVDRVFVQARPAPATPTPSATPSRPTSNDPDPNDPFAAIDPIVRPRIVGRMTVGSTITADCGKWKPTQYSCGVDWFRMLPDGTKVKLASSPKRNNQYVIKPADRGNRITAEVVVVHPTYESHVFTRPRLVR